MIRSIDMIPQGIHGNRFISITVCAFSKLVICNTIPNQTTETVVKALINDVIAKHGIPNEIVSDRGSNYTSEIFSQISKILGISLLLPPRCGNGFSCKKTI